MRPFVLALMLILLSGVSGCYQTVIETATPAGTEVIDIPWAHSFLAGLVPPDVVDSAATCPGGAGWPGS